MTIIVKTLPLAIASALLAGCGTVKQAYKPQQMGNLADHRNAGGIEVRLSPDKYRARIGDPVTFKVTIRNVGAAPILFPSDPDLLLTWIYPDGKRDNLVRGERAPSQNYIVLAPGDEHVAHSVVTTYYFDRGGIHEFRAIVRGDQLAMNTDRSAWKGRAVSNGFGVFFEER
jgi:hypothetical protein